MNLAKTINLHPKPSATAGVRTAVSTTAVASGVTPLATDYYALVEIQTNDMYVTFDGTTPSGTNGFKYTAGTRETWSKQRLLAAKFIRVSADGAVMVQPLTD